MYSGIAVKLSKTDEFEEAVKSGNKEKLQQMLFDGDIWLIKINEQLKLF